MSQEGTTVEAPPSIPAVSSTQPTTPAASDVVIPFDASELEVAPGQAAVDTSLPTDAQEFGFDDDNVRQYDFDFYKGRKGITDRIGVLALPYGARVHFKSGIGYFQCTSVFKSQMIGGQKIEVCLRRAPCCVHCDTPRKRFILPIIQYATRPDGKLTEHFGYALKGWLYTDDKYSMMKTINSEFPLLEHDILVTCTEEQYQKLTMAACKQALHRSERMPQNIKDEIKLWVDTMRPKMAKKVGKRITEQEFLQKAGLAPAPTVAPQMDAPMVDVAHLLD